MGFSGYPFTWKTTYEGGIKERLDRFCTTVSWHNLFHDANVTHLKFGKYDHIHVLLEANLINLKWYFRPFRFDEMWTHHENCEEVIRRAWNVDIADYPMFQVCKKIKATRLSLLKWQHSTFMARKFEIEKTRDQITMMDSQPHSAVFIKERRWLVHQLDSLRLAEKPIKSKDRKFSG